MAFEAAKQLSSSVNDIRGYMIEETSFHTPLIITLKEPIEVQISLRPEGSERSSVGQSFWYNFKIYSFHEFGSFEHCYGKVGIEYINQGDDINNSQNGYIRNQRIKTLVEKTYARHVSTDQVYNNFQATGYNYGPSFQALEDICYGHQASSANVRVRFEESSAANIIHPITLDAFMQVFLVASSFGSKKETELKLPTFIKSLWILNTNWKADPSIRTSIRFKASSAIVSNTVSSSEGDVEVCRIDDNAIVARIQGLKATLAADVKSSPDRGHASDDYTSVCRRIEWKPDISLLSGDELFHYCSNMQTLKPDPVEIFEDLDCFLYLAISRTANLLEEFKDLPNNTTSRYAEWIFRQYRSYEEEDVINIRKWQEFKESSTSFNILCSKVKDASHLGRLCIRIWESMLQILSGKVDPLSLLFQDSLLSDTYQELHETSNWYTSLENIILHLAHINAGLRILEIGAGTGATTRVALKALCSTSVSGLQYSRYSRYDFTDISSGFFENAKDKLQDFQRVNFLTLDIEQEPYGQGFDPGSYDLIIASLVSFQSRHQDRYRLL